MWLLSFYSSVDVSYCFQWLQNCSLRCFCQLFANIWQLKINTLLDLDQKINFCQLRSCLDWNVRNFWWQKHAYKQNFYFYVIIITIFFVIITVANTICHTLTLYIHRKAKQRQQISLETLHIRMFSAESRILSANFKILGRIIL